MRLVRGDTSQVLETKCGYAHLEAHLCESFVTGTSFLTSAEILQYIIILARLASLQMLALDIINFEVMLSETFRKEPTSPTTIFQTPSSV
jgi:hypothetical protein